MAPVQIVLCVEDSEYIELLLRYVRTSEYAAKVRIRAFSDPATFLAYMKEGHHRGLVAAEESFLQCWLTDDKSTSNRWVTLGEYEEKNEERQVIAKYQPLQRLLEQLCEWSGKAPAEWQRDTGKTMITTLYSTSPGSGKSVTAMNMAKQYGMRGESVFYLNLEAASSTHWLTLDQQSDPSYALSRLLYDLQAAAESKRQPEASPSQYAVRAEEIRADSFIPPDNFNELLHMTEEETEMLIRYIADSGEYDHLIIDVESGWNDRISAALKHSERIVWLLTDDLPCMNKTLQWMSYWQQYHSEWYEQIGGKVSFVMNRYTGGVMNRLPLEGMELEGTLPYVPSWKQVSNGELLWCSPIFQRDILKLCRLDHTHGEHNHLVVNGVSL
ncbi:ParA family protein [Paenibacillus sp. WLX1005]|uniref:ParA family protein n=1 Tax=Paenibacillus sp. WLX1005 TaxID=3243766 RepID=UPI0039840779